MALWGTLTPEFRDFVGNYYRKRSARHASKMSEHNDFDISPGSNSVFNSR